VVANGPVRRREYEADGEAADRRFAALEQRVGRLERQRKADMQALQRGEERRRWTRSDVIAVVAAAALLGTLALQAAGR
jgi:hypothetical protein